VVSRPEFEVGHARRAEATRDDAHPTRRAVLARGAVAVSVIGGLGACGARPAPVVTPVARRTVETPIARMLAGGSDLVVGGETLDAALAFLRLRGLVVICGAISQYNEAKVKGPENYLSLLVNRARMQGFIVFDFAQDYPRGMRDMGRWLAEGSIVSHEHIVKGLETFPETLLMLFDGRNQGKLVIEV